MSVSGITARQIRRAEILRISITELMLLMLFTLLAYIHFSGERNTLLTSSFRREIENLRVELTQRAEQLQKLEIEKRELQKKFDRLQFSYNNLVSSLAAAGITVRPGGTPVFPGGTPDAAEQIDQLIAQVKELEAQLVAFKKENEELREKAEEVKRLRAQVDALKQENVRLQEKVGLLEKENAALRAGSGDARALNDRIAALERENKQLRDRAILLEKENESLRARLVADSGGGGIEKPRCFLSATDSTEYLFDVSIFDDSFMVKPTWDPASAAEAQKVPGVAALSAGARIDKDTFRMNARHIYDWAASRKPECRFRVTVLDRTGTSKSVYKTQLDLVERHFYIRGR